MPMPPQPLSSDEESQAREWFPRIASKSDHVWLLQRNRTLQIIKAMWATIDALTTENATLKGALEAVRGVFAEMHPHVEGHSQGTCTERTDFCVASMDVVRVLAGKEAQCPKCEGRGFIRTMVDGQRDSEPCSYCRMSGLAGKEGQGG